MNSIIAEIKSLPPLSKTVLDVIEFSKQDEKTVEGLLEIIQDDTLLIASLLKISNSALFGFKNKVTDISNMVNLLGVNFTISLIVANSLENNFKTDFTPYGIDSEQFKTTTLLGIKLIQFWISKIDNDLKNHLILPAILLNLGKYLIAAAIIRDDKKEQFLSEVTKNVLDIDDIEKKYCGLSALEVSVLLLEYWKIDLDIIDNLRYIKNLSEAPSYLIPNIQILEIVKIVCNIVAPCDPLVINDARGKLQQYNLNLEAFDQAIEKVEYIISEN